MPRVPKPPVKAACLAWSVQYHTLLSLKHSHQALVVLQKLDVMDSILAEVVTAKAENAAISPVAEVELGEVKAITAITAITTSRFINPWLENTMGLLTPFVGINNLDQSPDSLSDTGEALQLWGQLTPGDDGSFTSASVNDVDLPAIRAYQSEEDILNAYYIYMHPYFPLLPPSPNPQYEDRSTFVQSSKQFAEPKKADLPYWPVSSLSLALSAILVLIPPTPDSSSLTEAAVLLRRSYAQLFAHAALSSVEREIDELSPASSINVIGASISQEQSQLHSQVPLPLDPILALVVLAMYEYCQRGNVSRMRARVNHAVTTAMDISLHDPGPIATEYSEAQRRAWWMIMFVAYISSNLHLTPPIIASDDPRITTPLPQFGVNPEPWGLTVRVQKLLYAAHSMVQKIESVADSPLISNLGDEIKKLDAQIVTLMIESDQSLRQTFDFEGESYVAENMWRMSRIMINT
ncbi:hypothetical protein N7466_002322 [Penicillium verhagenii]|uniref:uncharacterized protein n=1 Tax=Penicillium verhagenii TaxID=1562060 RepID=UPI00254539DC|nr:uncharacterized protein N7466_002322 [Penicillium verhagenii]KAJ5939188.1 hypothetical protein N7466_002322 [Penicillium verhagenii]